MMKRSMFGAAAAVAVAAWTLLEFMLGFHTTRVEVGRYTGFIGLVFPIVAIAAALRSARTEEGGALSFRRGLLEGASVTAVFSLLGAVFLWLYFLAINPGFVETMAAAGSLTTVSEQVTVAFIANLASGLVISLIAAALMRRRSAGLSAA